MTPRAHQESEIARQNFRFLLAFIDNPQCTRLTQMESTTFATKGRWLPRLSFRHWASNEARLSEAFRRYFSLELTFTMQFPQKDGDLYKQVPLSLMGRTIHADAVLHHEGQPKIVEFCCQPDREGHTSAFALQKSRYRAALASYAINPQNPASTIFLVLHRWDHIRIHLISIEYELNHIQAIIARPPPKSTYHYQRSCRWSCPNHDTCLQEAQEDGQINAWSPKLKQLSGAYSLWELKTLLASDGAHIEPFKTLAQTYTRAKEEKE